MNELIIIEILERNLARRKDDLQMHTAGGNDPASSQAQIDIEELQDAINYLKREE